MVNHSSVFVLYKKSPNSLLGNYDTSEQHIIHVNETSSDSSMVVCASEQRSRSSPCIYSLSEPVRTDFVIIRI